MVGMNRETGKALEGFDHLRQSIADILSTPKLTRVWRRDYGGEGTYLLDKPGTPETLLSFTIAIGDAINKWEPRYRLRSIWFERANLPQEDYSQNTRYTPGAGMQAGAFLLAMDGTYYPRGHLGDFTTGVTRGVELPLPTGYYVTGRVPVPT